MEALPDEVLNLIVSLLHYDGLRAVAMTSRCLASHSLWRIRKLFDVFRAAPFNMSPRETLSCKEVCLRDGSANEECIATLSTACATGVLDSCRLLGLSGNKVCALPVHTTV